MSRQSMSSKSAKTERQRYRDNLWVDTYHQIDQDVPAIPTPNTKRNGAAKFSALTETGYSLLHELCDGDDNNLHPVVTESNYVHVEDWETINVADHILSPEEQQKRTQVSVQSEPSHPLYYMVCMVVPNNTPVSPSSPSL